MLRIMLRIALIIASTLAILQNVGGQTCSGTIRGVIDGNVTLGFLFPFRGSQQEGSSCSNEVPYQDNIQLIEAARFALQNTQSAIPGVKIGLVAYDTCGSSKVGIERAVSFLSDRLVFVDEEMSTCPGSTLKSGVIAGGDSDFWHSVGVFLSDAHVPLIGFDTTLSELTSSDRYSYFTRALPSDNYQALAITNLIETLGWNYVATFHSQNPTDIGALEAFKIAANRTNICISGSDSVKSGDVPDSAFESLVQSFLGNLGPRVVVLFLPSDQLAQFFQAVAKRVPATSQQVQWIVGYRGLADPSMISSLPVEVTRGLLGVTPKALAPNTTQDFDNYFKSLTPEMIDTAANPWFKSFWQKAYQCNLDGGTEFPTNCSENHVQQHVDSYQRHPYVPAVIDSVKIFTAAIKSAHQTLCSGSSGVCPDLHQLSADYFYKYVIQVSTVGTGDQQIRYKPSGDLSVNTFSIVNFKTDGNALQEVGVWEDGNVTLPLANLELWSNGTSNQMVTSTCGDTCLDIACIQNAERLDKEVYLPGDIIMGGMFNIHPASDPDSDCGTSISESGVQRLEAMLFALNMLNGDNSGDNPFLPGIRFGMDGLDTCGNTGRAGHLALQLIADADFKASGSGEREGVNGMNEHLYAIVGPDGDDESVQVSEVLQVYNVPVIGYAADSATLSNSYFYPNYARVIAPSTNQIAALLGAIYTKGWFYIQAIHSQSQYGWNSVSVLKQQAPQRKVCLTQYQMMPTTLDDTAAWDDVLQNVENRKDAKVLVIISDDIAEYRAILDQLINRNMVGNYYLVATDGWPKTDAEFTQTYKDAIKGVTIIGKLTRQYDAFRDYFANLNPLSNTRNPWFAEYWMNKFGCSLSGMNSTLGPCTGNEMVSPDTVSDIHLADVVDAVYTVANLIKQLQSTKCPGQTGICQEMIDTDGEEIFGMLRTLQFDSINDGRTVKFDFQGNADTAFEVFNYQEQTEGAGFDYIQVGRYRTYTYLQQGYPEIKVYNSSGMVIPHPQSLCIGICADCKKTDKGKTAEAKNGDAYIGGFFRLHELADNQHDCKDEMILYNMQYIEAFLYAIDKVNSDPNVLPDLDLGGVAFDTCGSAKRAQRDAANFISATVEYRSGYPQNRVIVSGLIGEQTSDVTLALADVVTPLQVPQISYAATTTALDDNETFPFFQRTVASDSFQADALLDILIQMNWKYISVVYSDDEYGRDMYRLIVEKTKLKDICIAMSPKIPLDYDDNGFQSVVRTLRGNPQANVVLLLTSDYDARDLLRAAEILGVDDLQWVGTDTWGSRDYVTANSTMTSQGAITLQFRQVLDPDFATYYSNLNPYSNIRNPWWKLFVSRKYKCNLYGYDVPQNYDNYCAWDINKRLAEDPQEPEVSYIVLAVRAFAQGLHDALLELCPSKTNHLCNEVIENPKVLQDKVRAAMVPLDDDTTFQFDKNGNGPAKYDILNIQQTENSSQLNYRKVGSWISGRLTLNTGDLKFFKGNQETNNVNSVCEGRCSECKPTTSPDEYLHIDGELQIPGLFAIHEEGDHLSECGDLRLSGLLNLEAMLYAIDMINSDNAILPGITLGTTSFDTCLSSSRAVRDLSSLLSGSHVSLSTNQIWNNIAGVIGPESNEVSLNTALLTNQYKYTQISYGPGDNVPSPESYLYRAGPFASDDSKAMGVIELLQKYNWTYVSVVYSGVSNDEMDTINDATAFIEAASRSEICIATQQMLNNTHITVIDNILASDQANIVVAFVTPDDIDSLQHTLITKGNRARHLTWILAYPDDLNTDGFIIGGAQSIRSFKGSLAIKAEEVIPDNFRDYVKSLRVDSNQRNPWFREYIENTFNCSVTGKCNGEEGVSSDLIDTNGQLVEGIIDSVTAIAKGIHNLLKTKCPNTADGMCASFLSSDPNELRQAIDAVTFTRQDGSIVGFNDNAVIPTFKVWNYQYDNLNSFVKVGSWQPGSLTLMNNIQLFKGTETSLQMGVATSECTNRSLCGHCFPPTTPPMTTPTIAATILTTNQLMTTELNEATTEIQLTTTEKITTPQATTANPSTAKTTNLATTKAKTTVPALPTLKLAQVGASELNSVWFYVIMIISAIGMIITLALIILLIIRWKQPVAQAMSPFLLIMVLLGVFQMFTLVIVFAVPVSVPVCALQRLVSGLGFAFCHAGLLLMSVRLFRMGKHRTISGPKTSFIQTGSQVVLFLFLAAFQVVVDVEWLILEPPSLKNEGYPNYDAKPGGTYPPILQECNYSTRALQCSFIYVYILLILNLGMALLARRRIGYMLSMSLVQIHTLLLANIGSIVVMIIWILLGALLSSDLHRPSISILAAINGYIVLSAVFAYRAKILFTNHDPFDDSMGIMSGEFGMTTKMDVPGFDTTSHLSFENPAAITDLSDEVSDSKELM